MFAQPRFAGRLALVTGAAGGIGWAVCERLAQEGAAVVAVDRSLEDAVRARDRLRASGARAEAIPIDQRDPDAVRRLPATLSEMGLDVPDVLVCCAGVQTFEDILTMPIEDWDLVLDVNARGTFLMAQSLGTAMKATGRPGAIVNIASIQGRLGNVHYAPYAASKAAVISVTKSFALALAGAGIRVNAVAPGIVDTNMWAVADAELARLNGEQTGEPRARRISQVPLGRAGTPTDIAAAVAFLASDDADYVTGECLHVCGGDLML